MQSDETSTLSRGDEADRLAKSFKPRTFLEVISFGFVEHIVTYQQDEDEVLPRTERHPAKVSAEVNAQHPISKEFPPVKLRLAQINRVENLMFLKFEAFPNLKVPLFLTWGIAVSDINLICFKGDDGKAKVLKSFETPHDFEMTKQPKYGNFHVHNKDKNFFIKVTVGPSSWPGNAWEMQGALVVLHVEEFIHYFSPTAPSSVPTAPGFSRQALQGMSLEVGFYSTFGIVSPSSFFGQVRIPYPSGPTGWFPQPSYPRDQTQVVIFETKDQLDTQWDKLDVGFDHSIAHIPPPDGLLSFAIRDQHNHVLLTFVTAYACSSISESEDRKEINVHLAVEVQASKRPVLEENKDFGRRGTSQMVFQLHICAKDGKVFVQKSKFHIPLRLLVANLSAQA